LKKTYKKAALRKKRSAVGSKEEVVCGRCYVKTDDGLIYINKKEEKLPFFAFIMALLLIICFLLQKKFPCAKCIVDF